MREKSTEKLKDYQNLTKAEQQELHDFRLKISQAQKEEPTRLREHLQAFNDAIIAIIMTIIVLEIEPPINEVHYIDFLGDILIFLISFFIIADFWYELHLAFSYFILKPDKKTVIADFFLLADLSLLPIMTKWIMAEQSSFAVINFGVVFFIAQILKIVTQYFGTKPTMKDSKVMDILVMHESLRRLALALVWNLILILLAMLQPEIAMILYLTIPIASFLTQRSGRKH